MKKKNFKKLLKNIYIGVATSNLIGIIAIVIFILVLGFQLNQVDNTEMLNIINEPNSFISRIVEFSNSSLNNVDNTLSTQYPNLTETTLVYTTLSLIVANFFTIFCTLAFAGILLGLVYYNLWGKKLEIKNSFKKIILNYFLIELIAFIIVTLYGLIMGDIYYLSDMYTTTAIFYTLIYILIFIINYINNKRLSKKLNENL